MPCRRLPPKIHKNMQSLQAATVPIFRVLMRFWLPMRPGGLPYAGAVPMPDAFPHTFSAVPHTGHLPTRFSVDPQYHTQAPKIRLQSRRDQRFRPRKSPTDLPRKSRVSGIHIPPTKTRKSTSTPARPWHTLPSHTQAQPSPSRPASGSHKPSANPVHSNALRLRAARRRHVTTERKFVGSVGAGFLVKR